ncbi:MAG: endonuclease/exonuclease/phosphatase family protein, partial [Planctomycetota bacterium]
SFCFDGSLENASGACGTLANQVPVLEAWIDDRAAEETPFIVLGDFNRRFDAPGEGFWEEIDDGRPHNANLIRVTEGQAPLCWNRRFALFIDHIVLDRQAARWIVPHSFEQIVYQEGETLEEKLSDHCSIALTIDPR